MKGGRASRRVRWFVGAIVGIIAALATGDRATAQMLPFAPPIGVADLAQASEWIVPSAEQSWALASLHEAYLEAYCRLRDGPMARCRERLAGLEEPTPAHLRAITDMRDGIRTRLLALDGRLFDELDTLLADDQRRGEIFLRSWRERRRAATWNATAQASEVLWTVHRAVAPSASRRAIDGALATWDARETRAWRRLGAAADGVLPALAECTDQESAAAVVRRFETQTSDLVTALLDVRRRGWAGVLGALPTPEEARAVRRRLLILLAPERADQIRALAYPLAAAALDLDLVSATKREALAVLAERARQTAAAVVDELLAQRLGLAPTGTADPEGVAVLSARVSHAHDVARILDRAELAAVVDHRTEVLRARWTSDTPAALTTRSARPLAIGLDPWLPPRIGRDDLAPWSLAVGVDEPTLEAAFAALEAGLDAVLVDLDFAALRRARWLEREEAAGARYRGARLALFGAIGHLEDAFFDAILARCPEKRRAVVQCWAESRARTRLVTGTSAAHGDELALSTADPALALLASVPDAFADASVCSELIRFHSLVRAPLRAMRTQRLEIVLPARLPREVPTGAGGGGPAGSPVAGGRAGSDEADHSGVSGSDEGARARQPRGARAVPPRVRALGAERRVAARAVLACTDAIAHRLDGTVEAARFRRALYERAWPDLRDAGSVETMLADAARGASGEPADVSDRAALALVDYRAARRALVGSIAAARAARAREASPEDATTFPARDVDALVDDLRMLEATTRRRWMLERRVPGAPAVHGRP